ncbi:hypothetical protein BDN71DRAFT_1443726 [Pleurotus eryngii]|uniref:Uncharacterized protein n=1 Tax=Pleurotus eryngii TaxID=5323 RepID=A0A9P6A1V9_PLEER|nr:hypothetical protein BDN71DRAFT_1443726 [Pleurotus eryngii]
MALLCQSGGINGHGGIGVASVFLSALTMFETVIGAYGHQRHNIVVAVAVALSIGLDPFPLGFLTADATSLLACHRLLKKRKSIDIDGDSFGDLPGAENCPRSSGAPCIANSQYRG